MARTTCAWGCLALAALWVVACVWWRANDVPDPGPPFDVDAFVRTRFGPTYGENSAGFAGIDDSDLYAADQWRARLANLDTTAIREVASRPPDGWAFPPPRKRRYDVDRIPRSFRDAFLDQAAEAHSRGDASAAFNHWDLAARIDRHLAAGFEPLEGINVVSWMARFLTEAGDAATWRKWRAAVGRHLAERPSAVDQIKVDWLWHGGHTSVIGDCEKRRPTYAQLTVHLRESAVGEATRNSRLARLAWMKLLEEASADELAPRIPGRFPESAEDVDYAGVSSNADGPTVLRVARWARTTWEERSRDVLWLRCLAVALDVAIARDERGAMPKLAELPAETQALTGVGRRPLEIRERDGRWVVADATNPDLFVPVPRRRDEGSR